MANINLKENNVKNAEYIAGSVEDKIEEFKNRNIKPDVIVVDPPRKGLDAKSIEYILEFKKFILYNFYEKLYIVLGESIVEKVNLKEYILELKKQDLLLSNLKLEE